MGDENMDVLQLTMSLVSVYETGFVSRSLMAWGKKLLLSLSVPEKMVSWVFEDFSSPAFTAFEVDVLQRGESRPWDALS